MLFKQGHIFLQLLNERKALNYEADYDHNTHQRCPFSRWLYIYAKLTLENVSVIEFYTKLTFFKLIYFYKINSNNSTKKLIQLFKPNFNFNSTFFLYHKSINWTIQIIKFLNFKSPNFFKFQIDIETKWAFIIFVKLGFYLSQI